MDFISNFTNALFKWESQIWDGSPWRCRVPLHWHQDPREFLREYAQNWQRGGNFYNMQLGEPYRPEPTPQQEREDRRTIEMIDSVRRPYTRRSDVDPRYEL
jgi:hypothetical protein